jgi:ABC-2 type transport system permease protein
MAVYGFFGLLGPVLARYMQQLLEHSQSNLTITAGTPQPVDAMTNFVGEVNQTALVVAVAVAAGSLAFDARRGISTFLRTRTTTMRELLVPRYVVSVTAVVTAYLVGTLAAWYETTLLVGSLPATDIALGFVCGTVYLLFAMAVTAAAASLARSVLGTVGIAVGVLLALPILGTFSALHDWLPSSLATAPVALLGPAGITDYLPASAVTGIACTGLLLFAAQRLRHREL